jgi:hypothetical protein
MFTSFGTRGMRAMAALSAAAILAMPALADIVGNPGFVLIAQDGAGGHFCQMSFEVTQDGGGDWGWASNEPYELRDYYDNTLLGTLNPAGGPGSSIEYYNDPIVNLNFSVAAGASTTTFMIGSALLTFPTISPAQGRASAAFSVTDTDGSGVLLTGNGGNTGTSGYASAINGMAGPVPAGANQFTEMLPGVAAGPFGSFTQNNNTPPLGYLPIGSPVSSISSFISFTLTPFDLASGTSTFEVIPEPASVLLLVLGAGLLRRR